jgi:octaprenyl-diphosphate synthase
MTFFNLIHESTHNEMQTYTTTFANELSTENQMLTKIREYVIFRSGDRLIPILSLLSAKLCGEINTTTIHGALSLEFLYTASIIHGDVVDDDLSKGNKNNNWTNKLAILSGDYLLSKSLGCSVRTNNIRIINSISAIGLKFSDGELLKLSNSIIESDFKEDYLKFIRKKTASWYSTCFEVGGLSVNADIAQLDNLKTFGENLGICYHIKTEIHDFQTDLNHGKLTFPFYLALHTANSEEKLELLKSIKNHSFVIENSDNIITFTQTNGGFSTAEELINIHKEKAIKALSDFPVSSTKESLLMCIDSIVKGDANK